MTEEEITEKAQELTINNVTDGKNKYSYGFYKGCIVELEYNNKQITDLEKENARLKADKDMNVPIKWHKVADKDYPPYERGNYSINVLTNYGDIAYYDYDDDCWILCLGRTVFCLCDAGVNCS